ncbi:MAG: tRNA epoxyqueuosine(34) reductase QueG [Cytophagales bacterium]|nr:MAG: tRNA epoxyqueuosine(34) reductase QueG [Cytophagales bacterium]TAF61755.1 MAG: tRNA epoxyqueuosine(34) reductase QueG [Cytophagales bacterium]
MQSENYARIAKKHAQELGFSFCGIAQAEFLEEEAPRLEKWLKQGFHGDMGWMNENFDKRLDPRLLVEGAQSVISVLYNYAPPQTLFEDEQNFKISRYAYGKDYHKVIKKKLKDYIQLLKKDIGDFNGRAFVDSAPVMDKVWAKKAGLGWIGKHSNLINPKQGSYFFIAELILDVRMQPDAPIRDYCASCRLCIDACPTQAIVEPYRVDAQKCIPYLTIELKTQLPENMKGSYQQWIFGCDICQEVCPWTRRSKPHQEPAFMPNEWLAGMKKQDWIEMTEETFEKVFASSPVKRTKFEGLKRNILFLNE